jgi:NAD(P)-dependent dehydrogenase (short-subunit alcohol dehydrogenase family)
MKTVLITGANRGIGLEHARRYVNRGMRVLAAVRLPAEALELQELKETHPKLITILAYDAANLESPQKLAKEINQMPIDLLFANAGVISDSPTTFGSVDIEKMLELIRINAFAPLKLAEALSENVIHSERKLMAFQSSLMGSVSDNGSGGSYAYRVSKCALNMIVKNISNDLRSSGVTAVAMHPGWVRTRMGGPKATLSISQSVVGQQALIDSLSIHQSGQFINFDGTQLRW